MGRKRRMSTILGDLATSACFPSEAAYKHEYLDVLAKLRERQLGSTLEDEPPKPQQGGVRRRKSRKGAAA